jgi:hypothetical protein
MSLFATTRMHDHWRLHSRRHPSPGPSSEPQPWVGMACTRVINYVGQGTKSIYMSVCKQHRANHSPM